MLENDKKKIEKIVSIITPLDATLAKANTTNPRNFSITSNNILTNHPLPSILQVSEID